MDHNRMWVVIVSVIALALTLIVVGTTVVVRHDSTERLKACVENGGAYVRIPETTAMECER